MSCVAILEKHRGRLLSKPAPKLTPRQLDVLKLACDNLSNTGIAATLGITKKTVEKHRDALNKFAGANSPLSLYKWALIHGYVEMPKKVDK